MPITITRLSSVIFMYHAQLKRTSVFQLAQLTRILIREKWEGFTQATNWITISCESNLMGQCMGNAFHWTSLSDCNRLITQKIMGKCLCRCSIEPIASRRCLLGTKFHWLTSHKAFSLVCCPVATISCRRKLCWKEQTGQLWEWIGDIKWCFNLWIFNDM